MRLMSFFLTTPQFLDGSKDVTRRLGWKNAKAGDQVEAIRKGQGLKKGEKVERLGGIEFVSVKREALAEIVNYPDDCRREGFPAMRPKEFVEMFCHQKCTPATIITRIEFKRIG